MEVRGRPQLRRRSEWPDSLDGYAARVLLLVPLSITGLVVFTACLVVVVLAGLGIVTVMRGKRGE
jgi:hypothetical protein